MSFSFFSRKARVAAQLGVSLGSGMLAMARVSQLGDNRPHLDVCLETSSPEAMGWQAMEEQVVKNHLASTRMNVTLGAGDYTMFPHEAANVAKGELSGAMRWAVRNRLDFAIDEAVVEGFYIPDGANVGAGNKRKVYVVATRKPMVLHSMKLAASMGIPLHAVEVPEVSLGNLALLLPENQTGVGLLHLTADGGGVFIIASGGELYLARGVGRGEGGRSEFQSGGVEAIALDVQRSMDYYSNNFAKPPIAALYLNAELDVETAHEILSDRLSVRIKPMAIQKLLLVKQTVAPEVLARCLPAIGAALRPVEEGR